MATKSSFLFPTIFIVFFFIMAISAVDAKHHHLRKEKVTRLRFYWHDLVTGNNPTSITVAQAASTNASVTGFGMVQMIDNPLTDKPELTSKLVGRSQGFYASASQGDFSFLMNMNLVFLGGKYNGSTITVMGRNPVMDEVRELSIIGGSGAFRMARGYVLLRTHVLNNTTGDASVEYNAFFVHH